MEQKKLIDRLAEKVAKWLMKDIKLNAEAASSGHTYEPVIPAEIKNYKRS